MIDVAPATDEAFGLAEGPVWDERTGTVLWVDIPAGRVLRGELSADRVSVVESWTVDGTAGAVVPAADGALLVAAGDHLEVIDGDRRERSPRLLADGQRFNDGGCDPAGRFLVGTMALEPRTESESLFRYGPAGLVSLTSGLGLSNGLAWSPDGTTMYHVDTAPGLVWQWPYDVESGELGERSVLLEIADGHPDGLCVDVEGRLWVAIWGRGEVRCFGPQGQQGPVVTVPAPHTSSVAFVGPARDRLLVTTAAQELSDDQLAAFPLSGRLFLAEPGTSGVPTTPWRRQALQDDGL